jgi:hypothetical protein
MRLAGSASCFFLADVSDDVVDDLAFLPGPAVAAVSAGEGVVRDFLPAFTFEFLLTLLTLAAERLLLASPTDSLRCAECVCVCVCVCVQWGKESEAYRANVVSWRHANDSGCQPLGERHHQGSCRDVLFWRRNAFDCPSRYEESRVLRLHILLYCVGRSAVGEGLYGETTM